MKRYLDVCAGVSAASIAWKPLGWQCAGYAEIEPFPRAVLEQRHGGVPVDWDYRYSPGQNFAPIFGDFTKIEEHHVGPVDVLSGGTPWQAFSVAGKRLGLDDPRGNLAIEFLALAKRIRAKRLVWENVPGVFSSWSGEPDDDAIREWIESSDFAAFLDLFRECGYRGCYRVLDAQYVRVAGFDRAVPQRRRRVFLVGYLGNVGRAVPVLFDRESLRGNNPPRREAGESASQIAGAGVGNGGGGSDLIAPTVTSKWAKGAGAPAGDECQNLVAHTLRADGFDASEDGSGRGTPIVPVFSETSPTLAASAGGISGKDAIEGRLVAIDVAPTVLGGGNSTGGNRPYGTDGDTFTGLVAQIVSPTLDASYGRLQGASGQDMNHGHGHLVAFDTTHITSPTNGSNPQPGDAYHTVTSSAHVPAIAFSFKDSGNDAASELSPTLRSLGAYGANDDSQMAVAFDLNGREASWAVRRLTPRECERLQGFPDDFTAVIWRGKPASDGPRYKAIGNSMAVNVMRWIGTRIDYVDAAFEAGTAGDAGGEWITPDRDGEGGQ